MQKSNPSLTLAKKRLDINVLFNDDSLFDTFDFKSSLGIKLIKKKLKMILFIINLLKIVICVNIMDLIKL